MFCCYKPQWYKSGKYVINSAIKISLVKWCNQFLLVKFSGRLLIVSIIFVSVWCNTLSSISLVMKSFKCSSSVSAFLAAFVTHGFELMALWVALRPILMLYFVGPFHLLLHQKFSPDQLVLLHYNFQELHLCLSNWWYDFYDILMIFLVPGWFIINFVDTHVKSFICMI